MYASPKLAQDMADFLLSERNGMSPELVEFTKKMYKAIVFRGEVAVTSGNLRISDKCAQEILGVGDMTFWDWVDAGLIKEDTKDEDNHCMFRMDEIMRMNREMEED